MSITLTITAIAASLFIGGAIGRREQNKRVYRFGPVQDFDGAGLKYIEPDDIDSCITVYASEQTCECMDEHLLDVELNMRGQPMCTNCGRRRV